MRRTTLSLVRKRILPIALLLPLALPAPAPASPARRHAVYAEALGKGGLWGVGYDYLLSDRLALGATGSLYVLDGQKISTLSPYIGFYPVVGERDRLMIHAGPTFTRQSIESVVPEWSGISSGHVSFEAGAGWERRTSFLLRVYGMVAAGSGGVAPWLGVSVGWAF